VREPGRTAGPSASLGMTKLGAVTLMRGRQIGWTKKQQVPFDFAQGRLFASVARQAGADGMTISFKTR
jgi:hypothetical protein